MKTSKGNELPIMKLKGKDYMMVAYRLVWLRDEKPDWTIKTEIIHHDDNYSVVKAEIYNADLLISSGHKREDKKHFPDHLEKAETGAVGRALAMAGFGTQFSTQDMDEGERLADSPVKAVKSPKQSTEKVLSFISNKLKLATDNFKDEKKLKSLYKKIGVKSFNDLKAKTIEELSKINEGL